METAIEDKADEITVSQTSDEPAEPIDKGNEKPIDDSLAPVQEKQEVEVQPEPSIRQQPDADVVSPAPVAPPRRKRQQKKGAPPIPPPPRPKHPPAVVKGVVSKEKPAQGTSAQLDNQPCITVNSNTTDMNKMLMKGSANEVVKNQDLDECKSPMGSKVNMDKEGDGRRSLEILLLRNACVAKQVD